ncbi:MAG: hypothetical protein HY905_04840 [Deltaproteobacteria bacterium]|nr:hypothetical protein [Deltaproteobacteria bacterium]
MKGVGVWILLLAVLATLGCCPSAQRPAGPGPTTVAGPIGSGLDRTGPPDRREVFAVLARASGVSLAGNPSCDGVVPEVAAPTLADWVDYNLSVLEGDQIQIGAECVAADAAGEWQCDVTFHADFADSPDPWTWGVRFRLRDSDRSLVEDSILCTGAG